MTAVPRYARDTPAAEPLFDFDLVARALARTLAEPESGPAGAMVLGIHGPWGSGKTTLMRAVRRALEEQPGADKTVFLEFNAWKYRDRAVLWRALILTVIGGLRGQGLDERGLSDLEKSLYRTVSVTEAGPWQVNWRTLIIEVLSIALRVARLDIVATALRGTSGFLGRLFGASKKPAEGVVGEKDIEKLGSVLERATVERQIDHVQSIEQFLEGFRNLMRSAQETQRSLCVFVDDLDRCLPDDALEVFEAVKLFLDASGCSFVMALDRDVIRKGLARRYPGVTPTDLAIDPDEYLEKTITISYDLPRLSEADARALTASATLPFSLTQGDRTLLRAGLGANPRRIKRFANLLALHCDLAALAIEAGRPAPGFLRSDDGAEQRGVYLKLLLLSYRYSAMIDAALDDPGLLSRMQATANRFRAAKQPVAARKNRHEELQSELVAVRQLGNEEALWDIMACKPDFGAQTDLLETLDWFRRLSR